MRTADHIPMRQHLGGQAAHTQRGGWFSRSIYLSSRQGGSCIAVEPASSNDTWRFFVENYAKSKVVMAIFTERYYRCLGYSSMGRFSSLANALTALCPPPRIVGFLADV